MAMAVFDHIRFSCPCDETTFYPQSLLAERAEGIYVWTRGDERPYMDLVLGYSSLNFGHCHPRLVAAAQAACARLTQIHGLNCPWKLDLSARLVAALPLPASAPRDYQVYFDVGGSAAVSAALRLCRHATGRSTIVGFAGAFHGITLDAAAVSDDRLLNRAQYGTLLPSVIRVPYPRAEVPGSTDETMDALNNALLCERELPAAVIVEPVQGAGGFIIPPVDFLSRLSMFCLEREIPLVIDEIQSGVGRCGSLFAYDRFAGPIRPDIVLLSKSLAGGIFPLSAVIARAALFASVPRVGSAFQSTFNNNPLGAAVALTALALDEELHLFAAVAAVEASLLEQLAFVSSYKYCSAPRGIGFAVAFDVVEPQSKERHARPDIAKELMTIACEEHVLLYVSGVHRNTIKIAPPITADSSLLTEIIRALRRCLDRLQDRHATN